jgi:ketosteroid isomerase-like protein
MFKGALKFEIRDLSINADRLMGFSHSIQRVTGTDTKGNPVDLTVRVTDVYRKIKGNWLIVHEHVSVPVDLDTGKPDLSSKP